MTHLIKVINKGHNEIIDYFDGMPYRFLPDEPINVPLQAMAHIFGIDFPADQETLDSHDFREEAFAAVSRRWGWNSHSTEAIVRNRKVFNQIKFIPVIMQQVELIAKLSDMPPPRDKKSDVKAGKFKPRIDEIEEIEETSEDEVG